MIRNFAPRLYQQTILGTTANFNTLVVLPTGLGKTGLAFMLAAQRLNQYPNSKILLLSPTKPLCEQHQNTFKKHLETPEEKIVLFTGEISPKKRETMWKDAKIIISTPQGLENDVINKRIKLEEVSLLVFDEAHHATGEYSYVWVAQQYEKISKFSRILALTASPGSDMEKIREICQNLFIEKVEVRTEQDPDVKPYVQQTKINWIKVEFPEEFKKIQKHLRDCKKSKLLEAQRYDYCNSSEMMKGQLLKLQGEMQRKLSQGVRDFELLRSVSLVAEALKVEHGLELLESQGVIQLQSYLNKIQQESLTTKVKATKNLVQDLNFKSALYLANELVEQDVQHPKLIKLKELVKKEFEQNKDGKMIIFTQFRNSAEEVVKTLDELQIKNSIFVGQAKKNGLGFSQKQQKEILDKFRVGEFNILVATSVGEEGLDIPAVDKVVFYEPVPSAIRKIQRCVPGGTKILCENGLYKPIEKILEGEAVISLNEKTLRLEPKKILKTFRNKSNKLIKLKFSNGTKINVTEEHPLLTKSGWKNANEVELREEIASIHNTESNSSCNHFASLLPKETYLVGLNKQFKGLKNKSGLMFKELSNILNREGILTNKKTIFSYSKNKAIPIRIFKEIVKLSGSLSLNDILKTPFIVKSKYGKNLRLDQNIYSDFMWLVGIVASDGGLRTEISNKWKNTKTHRIRVTNKNEAIIERVKTIFSKLGVKPYINCDNRGIYRIEVCNFILGEILLKLGIKNKNKTYNIEASNFIYEMPKELIAAYLSGVFDGDGNYNNNPKNSQQQIRIGTASMQFAEDLQNLFLKLGIYSKIICSHRKEERIIYGKNVNFDLDFYSVEFYCKSQVKSFFDYGFIVKNKFVEAEGRKVNRQNVKIEKDILWISITGKEIVKKTIETYNLRIEDNDNYVASNVIVHNCGRTGRLEKGEVTMLLTSKTRDEAYRWSAHHKEKRMYRNLEELKKGFSLQPKEETTLQKFIPEEKVVAILADHREKDNRTVKELIDLGVSVRTGQLETADYLVSGRVGVELKKVPDFVASIIDGRMLEQVRGLKQNFEKAIVIIEGEEDIYSVRKVHANAIRGMLASIVLDFHVPVLYTKNPRDTAGLLAVMAKREQDKGGEFSYHQGKPQSMKEQQEFLVSAMPGIGISTARNLLNYFGSVRKLVNATKEELEALEGIGGKTSERLVKLFEGEYER